MKAAVAGVIAATAVATAIANPNPEAPSAPLPEVYVGGGVSREGGVISTQMKAADGKSVLHGLQVSLGPGGRVRALDTYSNGVRLHRRQLHSNGNTFRYVQTLGRDTYDYEVIYDTENEQVCIGSFKGGKRWNGSFLGNDNMYVYPTMKRPLRVALYTYKEGKLLKKVPFDMKELKLPEESWLNDELLWQLPG